MDFIPGGELLKHAGYLKRFPEDQARFYIIQVALVLGYLHQKGVLYRDIKPENILLGEDGYISLIDFGLAKILDGKKKVAHSLVGTAEYMAPEILDDKGYSFQVDWWTLGVLVYELIFGFTPFHAKSGL